MHAAPSPDHRDDAAVQLSDQAIGRIVDGEPLPGDAALVAETLRRHPEMFARLEQHLAIDAMLYDQAGPDADAFVDAVRVAIEAKMSRPAFVRKVREAIFGGSPDNHAVAAPAQTVTAARSIWSGRSSTTSRLRY